MQEVDNVLRILKETKESINNKDAVALKTLSNQTIHTAAVSQDPDNIAVAVIVYSIGKIIERSNNGEEKKYAGLYNRLSVMIDKTIFELKSGNQDKVRKNLNYIRKDIERGSGDFKRHIQDVFRKASINKASKIYEHGISMETTASLLGITMFELASYAGQKQVISEEKEEKTISAKERIKIAMEMFE
ncbi:MAG: hypothetical protein WC584_00755 [Candidatus Pacearchaeota archaeon]